MASLYSSSSDPGATGSDVLTIGRERIAIGLSHTPDVDRYCRANGLDDLPSVIENLIRKHFRGIKSIRVGLSRDPEISGYEKVRFDVTLTDTPERILAAESRYDLEFSKYIPEDKQEHFVLTYHVV